MFERFTEPARRAIFFGRFEASTLGSPWIEAEHLLLGLLREDRVLPHDLSIEAKIAIRKRIEEQRGTASIPTSVDLPLSRDSQHILHFAAEESDKLRHNSIDTGHLVLGLLRIDCLASSLLRQHGIEYESYRQNIHLPIPEKPLAALNFDPAPPSLVPLLQRLQGLVDATLPHLAGYSEADSDKILKRKPWTRKEALGHLVDCASSHHQWFARALTESSVTILSYPQDNWVTAQSYRDFSWPVLVDLWGSLNDLLIHVLTHIPEEKVNTPCRIGVEAPIPLSILVTRYALHCEDVAGQIVARL
jgi:Clp amino terminal domain, pathogenicity island component